MPTRQRNTVWKSNKDGLFTTKESAMRRFETSVLVVATKQSARAPDDRRLLASWAILLRIYVTFCLWTEANGSSTLLLSPAQSHTAVQTTPSRRLGWTASLCNLAKYVCMTHSLTARLCLSTCTSAYVVTTWTHARGLISAAALRLCGWLWVAFSLATNKHDDGHVSKLLKNALQISGKLTNIHPGLYGEPLKLDS